MRANLGHPVQKRIALIGAYSIVEYWLKDS